MHDSLATAPPLVLAPEDPWIIALKAIIVFFGVLIIGLVVRFVGIRAVERLSARTKTRVDDILIRTVRGPLVLWFIILGLNLASRLLHHNLQAQLWIDRLSIIAWIISLTWAASRFAGEVISEYGAKIGGALPVTSLTRNITRIVIYTIGVLFVLQALSISITPILTALGVGGLAVALALQDTLSNLFSGMYLMMAKQVRIGDYIKLDSGFEGHVSDITWRTTTIRALSNNNILVPNIKMAQAIITNYHMPDPRMAVTINVSVPYDSDPDFIEKILVEEALKVADTTPGLLKDPKPTVGFAPGFGEYALAFTLTCQVKQFTDQYPVQNALRKAILKRFQQEGIRMPMPQRHITVLPGGGNPVTPPQG